MKKSTRNHSQCHNRYAVIPGFSSFIGSHISLIFALWLVGDGHLDFAGIQQRLQICLSEMLPVFKSQKSHHFVSGALFCAKVYQRHCFFIMRGIMVAAMHDGVVRLYAYQESQQVLCSIIIYIVELFYIISPQYAFNNRAFQDIGYQYHLQDLEKPFQYKGIGHAVLLPTRLPPHPPAVQRFFSNYPHTFCLQR